MPRVLCNCFALWPPHLRARPRLHRHDRVLGGDLVHRRRGRLARRRGLHRGRVLRGRPTVPELQRRLLRAVQHRRRLRTPPLPERLRPEMPAQWHVRVHHRQRLRGGRALSPLPHGRRLMRAVPLRRRLRHHLRHPLRHLRRVQRRRGLPGQRAHGSTAPRERAGAGRTRSARPSPAGPSCLPGQPHGRAAPRVRLLGGCGLRGQRPWATRAPPGVEAEYTECGCTTDADCAAGASCQTTAHLCLPTA